jgi:HIP---CoA ligase
MRIGVMVGSERGRDEIANYKVPRAIEIVDELPVNATGKVEKNELRARAAQSRPVSAT